MRRLFLAFLVCCLSAGADAASGKEKDGCTHTWGKGQFKTFKQVESEVHNKLGSVKILRMALCGSADEHYFRVTVLHPSGTVDNLQIAAH